MENSIRHQRFLHSLLSLCRALLLCATALFIAPQAKAQFNVYYPFPDSNAVWGMYSGCNEWNYGTYRFVQNYYGGDTVIDGNLYKIINEALSPDFESCSCGIPEDLGAGFLRDDTLTYKVYWRIPGMSSDTLLYDFTLEMGDTLRGLYGNTGLCSEAVFTVQSIDSVQVGSSYRKRINFSNIDLDPCNPTSIIEGVGSTTGLTACYATPTSFAIRLDCFTVGDSMFYTRPCGPSLSTCGNLTNGVRDVPGRADHLVTFHPNPTPGIVRLVCHFDQPALVLLICDVTCKDVFQSRITGEQTLIDISALRKGINVALV